MGMKPGPIFGKIIVLGDILRDDFDVSRDEVLGSIQGYVRFGADVLEKDPGQHTLDNLTHWVESLRERYPSETIGESTSCE
jgi:hypothetical protein